jgi:UDP-2,3-diacylglucosamine hydrolase
MNEETAYFISDAHLGISPPEAAGREEALISFLREVAPGARFLFILGDLFDFWVEYSRAIRPDYFRVLHELRRLVEGGTIVHYFRGNHDFAVGRFLSETVGVRVHPGAREMEIQGRRLRIAHGDGMLPSDRANRVLGRLLRSPALQSIYKILHPNLGVPLGEFISGLSRSCLNHPPPRRVLESYRRLARGFLERGDDIVILGHTHVPELIRYPAGTYCNSGSFLQRYSFARLLGGEMTLWSYTPGEDWKPIPEIEVPGE